MRQHMVNASGRESCTQCCVFFSFHWANPKSKRKMKHLMARASESRFFSYVNWCFKRTCVALELRRFCFSVVFFSFFHSYFQQSLFDLESFGKKETLCDQSKKKPNRYFMVFAQSHIKSIYCYQYEMQYDEKPTISICYATKDADNRLAIFTQQWHFK